jgi:hypothetical protein
MSETWIILETGVEIKTGFFGKRNPRRDVGTRLNFFSATEISSQIFSGQDPAGIQNPESR